MSVLLAQPARLPLTLSTVDEALDPSPSRSPSPPSFVRHGLQHHHYPHSRRQHYLQSLISPFGGWAGKGGSGIYERAGGEVGVVEVEVPESLVYKSKTELRRADRSLSAPILTSPWTIATTSAREVRMATHDIAPSSPPELSYDKSSKSSTSSLHSSHSSLDEGSVNKLSHGDEVAITDEPERESIERDSNLKPESRPTLRRPPPRQVSMGNSFPKSPGASPPSLVHRVPSRENAFPTLRGAVNGVLRDQSLNLPGGLRRGFTSPVGSSFTAYKVSPSLNGQRTPSRSPSPSKSIVSNAYPLSPQSSTTSRLSAEGGPLSRRQSWQPGRKSVKELEAECNDDDEEVPDDAVLENVPISPMPGQPRRFSPHPSRSTTPSPHRRSSYATLPSGSHANLHSANVPKKAKRPSAPAVLPNGQFAKPRSPRTHRPPMLQHSATFSAFPPEPLNVRHRSKSWTEDLSHEARQLSAALEEYADRVSTEKHQSRPPSAAGTSPRTSGQKPRPAPTSILEFPVKQRGNIMIDPLPISKEKEAVLTRTRPSWLPPKSQKEEKKHLREWERMMTCAAVNEKKRVARQREAAESQEELRDHLSRLWDEHVLRNWETAVHEPRTRELWWRGVAPTRRGLVWQKAIGNALELSDATYHVALSRATALVSDLAALDPAARRASAEAAWFDAIDRDVPVACPSTSSPEADTALRHALTSVLQAYTLYRRDVGYVYGTHLLATPLCRHMSPGSAFTTLANLLNRPLPLAFLLHDPAAMSRAYTLVLQTLRYKFPSLHAHLTSPALSLPESEYLDPFFRTLGAYHLPPTYLARVWDLYVFEGDKALVRVLVAVLGRLEGRLYVDRDDVLEVLGWQREKFWEDGWLGSEEEFIAAVREAGKVDPASSAASSTTKLGADRTMEGEESEGAGQGEGDGQAKTTIYV